MVEKLMSDSVQNIQQTLSLAKYLINGGKALIAYMRLSRTDRFKNRWNKIEYTTSLHNLPRHNLPITP